MRTIRALRKGRATSRIRATSRVRATSKGRATSKLRALLCLALLLPGLVSAASEPRLALPDFKDLADKATESVVITMDPSLLNMASRFMDAGNAQDAAAIAVIKGLQGIYVRSFSFDHDDAYRPADVAAIRKQLADPGWKRVVETRSKKTHADVDIYLMSEGDKVRGLALIASEPRALTIVNIVGAIDLDKLRKLEGQFGVPKLDLDATGTTTP
jgi:hypothetical protein